jgi:hypothetical protein
MAFPKIKANLSTPRFVFNIKLENFNPFQLLNSIFKKIIVAQSNELFASTTHFPNDP